MNRYAVQSSTVKSVGYDDKTLTLEVEFTNGNIYQYFDVPATLHSELMGSGSHGQFLNKQIKGQYRYAKV
jgi:hypothetical protein